jgi:p-aminobenzoyl-glutamate transporter AbgT
VEFIARTSNQDCAPPTGIYRRPGIFIRRTPMMDAVMMVIAFVFFALSIAYCYACDRL